MDARQLLSGLQDVDSDAVTLWLPSHADACGAEEACPVTSAIEPWTRGRRATASGELSDAPPPSSHGFSVTWTEATDPCRSGRVLLLSALPEAHHG
ncbi:hypothetical protein ABIE53_000222 [Burkholderia sp. OAS925]